MKSLTPAFVTFVMLLIIGGLIAAYFVKNLFATKPAPVVETTRTIPVALQDLEPGTEITSAHLGRAPINKDRLTRETVLTSDALIGRVVKAKIVRAEPINSSQLYAPGERPPLKLSVGMRAVSVGVSDNTAMVDGLITPGQYVDVHFTPNIRGDERAQGGFTMTLFRGVKLLAINRSIVSTDVTSRGGNTVTLELTPEQANIMILAREKGDINLVYNSEGLGNGGVSVSSSEKATLDEILGLKEPEKPEEPFSTDVYYGSSRNTYYFRDGRLYHGDDNRPNGSQRNTIWGRGGNSGRGYGRNSSQQQPNPNQPTISPEGNNPGTTNGPNA